MRGPKRCPMLAIGLLVFAGSANGQTAEPPPPDTPGIYLGGQFGRSSLNNACQPQALSCDRRDNAWGVFAGYRFSEHIRVELGYLDFGQTRATYPRLTSTLQ